MTLKTFLKVTKQVTSELRDSVTRIELENAVSAGVSWGSLDGDMVPIFEEHISRLERGYTIDQWYELDPMERAMVVAIRRIDISTKNLQAEADIRAAKRNQRKGA